MRLGLRNVKRRSLFVLYSLKLVEGFDEGQVFMDRFGQRIHQPLFPSLLRRQCRDGQIIQICDLYRGGHCALRKSQHAIFRTRSEEHTSELQSLMRISYAVFCLKKKKK